MLAKDYRTRVPLEAIIIDDWVTSEGSEPLFDCGDYTGTNYAEFISYAIQDDPLHYEENLKVLIVDGSWVNRTMLSHKICNIQHAICACLESHEEALDIMVSAMHYDAMNNFDYLFVETMPDNKGLETIKEIRKMGFKGYMISMTYIHGDLDCFIQPDAADVVIRCPVSVRELTKILSKEAFEQAFILHKTDSTNDAFAIDDVAHAITFSSLQRSASTGSGLGSPGVGISISMEEGAGADSVNADSEDALCTPDSRHNRTSLNGTAAMMILSGSSNSGANTPAAAAARGVGFGNILNGLSMNSLRDAMTTTGLTENDGNGSGSSAGGSKRDSRKESSQRNSRNLQQQMIMLSSPSASFTQPTSINSLPNDPIKDSLDVSCSPFVCFSFFSLQFNFIPIYDIRSLLSIVLPFFVIIVAYSVAGFGQCGSC